MTIILAASTGKEICFAYDTAATMFFKNPYYSLHKIEPITKTSAGGVSGSTWGGLNEFMTNHRHEGIDKLELFKRIPHTMWGAATRSLYGIIENGKSHLYVNDLEAGLNGSEVQAYGIGIVSPNILKDLYSLDPGLEISLFKSELEKIAKNAIDSDEHCMLYGFGSAILDQSGLRYLTFIDAQEDHYLKTGDWLRYHEGEYDRFIESVLRNFKNKVDNFS